MFVRVICRGHNCTGTPGTLLCAVGHLSVDGPGFFLRGVGWGGGGGRKIGRILIILERDANLYLKNTLKYRTDIDRDVDIIKV